MTTDAILARLNLDAPPVQWDAIYSGMDETTLEEIAGHLDGRALAAVRLAAYVNARSYGHNHKRAVITCNQASIATARALGYSYPERHSVDF